MKRLIPLLVLLLLVTSCKKSSNTTDFIREKNFGNGIAFFIASTADSGLVACGRSEDKPLLIRLDHSFSPVLEITDEEQGLFSSAWFDTSGYIAGGNTAGNILLARYSRSGKELWKKTIDAGYYISLTRIFYTGSGNLLAVCSDDPDSVNTGATGLYFIRFDTTGNILDTQNIASPSFTAAGNAAVDSNGDIFLALTIKAGDAKPVAAVARYNGQFQMLWETDLYNNPEFSAAGRSVLLDSYGNVYVTGNTELPTSQGNLSNTFVVSLDKNGNIRENWKKYPEESNQGTALLFDETGNILVLNRNCFIVNVLGPDDGTDIDRIRMFNLCSPDDTDAFGKDFALSGSNILVAGSLGGNFFVSLKSTE